MQIYDLATHASSVDADRFTSRREKVVEGHDRQSGRIQNIFQTTPAES
jgi:hypothetical protein